jgi:methionyl-tRNA synthetase
VEDEAVKELDRIFAERMEKAARKPDGTADKKKPEISFEEFSALDIRVGQIKDAQAVKGSKKLLRLQVDIGGEIRQVVAGIAEAYPAGELIGTQVVVLVNLKPAKLFGIESQAMLLAADQAGKAVLLRPSQMVETGTKVR